MPKLWTLRNPGLVCMSFALYLHVINFMFKCTILPPQFFSSRVPTATAPHHSPQPLQGRTADPSGAHLLAWKRRPSAPSKLRRGACSGEGRR